MGSPLLSGYLTGLIVYLAGLSCPCAIGYTVHKLVCNYNAGLALYNAKFVRSEIRIGFSSDQLGRTVNYLLGTLLDLSSISQGSAVHGQLGSLSVNLFMTLMTGFLYKSLNS